METSPVARVQIPAHLNNKLYENGKVLIGTYKTEIQLHNFQNESIKFLPVTKERKKKLILNKIMSCRRPIALFRL